MATCETWEAPYVVNGFAGSTPGRACTVMTDLYNQIDPSAGYTGGVVDGMCVVTSALDQSVIQGAVETRCEPISPPNLSATNVECGAACSIAIQLTPAEPDAEHIADIGTLFGLFLGACVVVYCGKQLLNLFRINQHED